MSGQRVVKSSDLVIELSNKSLPAQLGELPIDEASIFGNVGIDEILVELAVDVACLIPQKLLSGVHDHDG